MPTFLIFFPAHNYCYVYLTILGQTSKVSTNEIKGIQIICFLISLHCNCMGLIKERVQNETKKGCYKNKLLLFGTPETAS